MICSQNAIKCQTFETTNKRDEQGDKQERYQER